MKHILNALAVVIVVVNIIVGNIVVKSELSLTSIFKMSIAGAEYSNSDPCMQRSITILEVTDCSSGGGNYGRIESSYWCDGGSTGTCQNGDYEGWWDCDGKSSNVDYTTIDPC